MYLHFIFQYSYKLRISIIGTVEERSFCLFLFIAKPHVFMDIGLILTRLEEGCSGENPKRIIHSDHIQIYIQISKLPFFGSNNFSHT